jgi:putative ABC transport system permease protein
VSEDTTGADRPGSEGRFSLAGRFNSWRVAVRIARRDAWRAKGRSAMVLAMIALPIVGVSAADITIRSSQLSPEQKVTRDLGAADARLTDGDFGPVPIYQAPTDDEVRMAAKDANSTATEDSTDGADQGEEEDLPAVDVPAAMPPGARWLLDVNDYAQFKTKYGLLYSEMRELKAADPMARGIMDLDRGRYPEALDEVMATNAFLKSSGLHVGSTLKPHDLDRTYRIVGAYDLPNELKTEQLNALPGAFIEPYDADQTAHGGTPYSHKSYLVSVPGDFTWQMVMKANTKGVVVDSHAVRLHPPAHADVPLFTAPHGGTPALEGSSSLRATQVAAATTIVGLSMLEICLLAGPAFAVGARRSRRQLGLVGANGGDRRHIRAIVLSGGLVIGAAAAVCGTVLGLLLTAVLRGPLEEFVGKRFGGLTLRPLELLGIAALAVLTGLLAAIAPAVTASRQSVLMSLTGRRGIRHANRVLPVVGLGAVCLGAGVAVFGSMRTSNAMAIGAGSGIAELGVVALTPTLVGLFGRLGRWLPLAPRLALRDAVRNRGRTAPAVAAVLAAVAGTVAVATYATSNDRGSRDEYQARLPYGTVSVAAYDGKDLDTVRAAIEKRFPVEHRADVSQLAVGPTRCDYNATTKGCGDIQPEVPKANKCPMNEDNAQETYTEAQRRAFAFDWRCASGGGSPSVAISGNSGVLVGGADVMHSLGVHDKAAEQALARGETVLFDKTYADRGSMMFKVVTDVNKYVPDGQEPVGPVKALPAYVAHEGIKQTYGLVALVPPKAAADAGIRTIPAGSYYTTSRMPDSKERQGLQSDLAKIGTNTETYVERGYTAKNSLVLLALTLFAGLVTVGAAGIATGLAQADAEPDLKTLSAIGAPPRVRRLLSAFQCGVVAAMGVLLGSAAGVLPAIGLRRNERRLAWVDYWNGVSSGWAGQGKPHVPIVIPWSTLGLLLIAVPVGAALLAGLVTRSRGQLGRRAET